MEFLILLGIFFLGVVIHEYAHGKVALMFGDHTAKYAGRLSLNPLRHIDPIGTIILPIMLILASRLSGKPPVIFGWAKPVPVNYWGLKNPKRDIIWVGLAGPTANIILAAILAYVVKIVTNLPEVVLFLIKYTITINLVLAFFNLIPIPPLDGSRILFGLLPQEAAKQYAKLEKYGLIIIFAILYFCPGIFDFIRILNSIFFDLFKITI